MTPPARHRLPDHPPVPQGRALPHRQGADQDAEPPQAGAAGGVQVSEAGAG